MARHARRRRRDGARTAVALIVSVTLVATLAIVGVKMWHKVKPAARTDAEGCHVVVDSETYWLDLEQSENAAIIVAESIRRGLPPRAASIALATAMQESGLRNLDYGDRDSLGLFQQRPSQGWGTAKQVRDPWYASGKFYDELVHVSDWRTGDINDVAQEVQRSGVPDGYRKHVAKAKAWASVLTGQSAQMVSCVNRSSPAAAASQLAAHTRKGLGTVATIRATGDTVTIGATSATTLRAAINITMASTNRSRLLEAHAENQVWKHDPQHFAQWTAIPAQPAGSPGGAGSVHGGSVIAAS